MPILGAHMSIAGGFYKAVERAASVGCQCVQLFSKNNNQWAAKPITDQAAQRFQKTLAQFDIRHPLIHDSYLINLASPENELWKKSIDAMVDEFHRAEQLGIPRVVTHPGAYTTGSEPQGLQRIVEAIDEIHAQTVGLGVRCLLETTAGQGTALGWRFEQLAAVLEGVKQPDRLGVCFDTCHVFAAGYPLGTAKDYQATMGQFDKTVGLGRIEAFHFNDSRRDLGSHVDRHTHIGQGELGIEAFRHILNDPRFREIPIYLETPKHVQEGVDMDRVNLGTLRALV